jgi:hypothetical protein
MVQLHHHTSSFHVPSILQLEIFPGEKQKKGKEINKEKINVHIQCSTSTCLAEIKMSAPLQQLKSNQITISRQKHLPKRINDPASIIHTQESHIPQRPMANHSPASTLPSAAAETPNSPETPHFH